jgi:phage terminase large subunit-like protein
MGLSLQDRVALLPMDVREQWLAEQPENLIKEMIRGEWWWVARPEQIPPPGNWLVCLALAGRGFGKAISVSECLVSAPSSQPDHFSLRKLGDLSVGDWVLDEQGKPCRITAVFDSMPQQAYRIHFNDGTHIDACSEHQWVTWEHRDRKAYLRSEYEADTTKFPENWPTWRPLRRYRGDTPTRDEDGPGPRIRTTEDIVRTLHYGKHSNVNHCIPVAGALALPEQNLPLDPWVLGYWLGNGSQRDASMVTHGADLAFVGRQVAAAGFDYSLTRYTDRNAGLVGPRQMLPALREAKVLGDKHVPEPYLWGSIEQRRQLLAGLMDSDGYGAASSVEFCSTVKVLADAVAHLARSLGQRPTMYEERAKLYGMDMGPKFRVCWRPTFNPFTSPRKMATYVPPGAQGLRTQHRMITNVEPIDPTPMRCLTVDSPNSMYLIGEGFIPTHNSRAGSEWIVDQAMRHPYDNRGTPTEWLVIAETLSDARTICMEGPAGILRVLERRSIRHRYLKSPRPMVLFPNGAKIYTEGADDPDVGRGYNASGAWLDELGKWRWPRRSWYEGIMPSLRADLAGDHPRAFVTTTPKPIDILQEWVGRNDGTVHVIRGSTFDNRANLSTLVIEELKRRYEGTIIGRQELYGDIIEAFEGALFSRLDIENNRVDDTPDNIIATVVGVDPSLTGEDDEMGIVVVARSRDNHLYVLGDRSIMSVGRAAALEAWRIVAEFGADRLVCETNLGKRWMQQVFNDAYYELVGAGVFPEHTKPPVTGIDTKIGKRTRGEPVAMRCEQGRLHHVGHFPELENQMATFVAWGQRESPDRLDALVHACRFLMDGEKKAARLISPRDTLSTTLQSLWQDAGSYTWG